MTGKQAIVPTAETALAKTGGKAVNWPKKRRCYAVISPHKEEYREPGERRVELRQETKDDLSSVTVSKICWHLTERWYDLTPILTMTLAAILVVPFALILFLFGVAMWGCIGLALMPILLALLLIGIVFAKADKRQREAFDGYLTEELEIEEGERQITQLALHESEGDIEIPLESVFLALNHRDRKTRNLAAKIAAKLPDGLRAQAISRYRNWLSADAARALSGMEDQTAARMAVMGFGEGCIPYSLAASEWDL